MLVIVACNSGVVFRRVPAALGEKARAGCRFLPRAMGAYVWRARTHAGGQGPGMPLLSTARYNVIMSWELFTRRARSFAFLGFSPLAGIWEMLPPFTRLATPQNVKIASIIRGCTPSEATITRQCPPNDWTGLRSTGFGHEKCLGGWVHVWCHLEPWRRSMDAWLSRPEQAARGSRFLAVGQLCRDENTGSSLGPSLIH